jgi:hypothetical protein
MKKKEDEVRVFQKKNLRGILKETTFLKNQKKQKGQVWVETVIYLLIAFVMIGLVLSFIKPKIEEMRDRTIIEQSLGILKEIDSIITTIGSPGNQRLINVEIRKGSIIIDSENDIVKFEIDSTYEYGQPGQVITIGNIQAITEESGDNSKVTLTRDFSEGYDLTYDNQQMVKTLTKASNPYRLFINNRGESSDKVLINFGLE